MASRIQLNTTHYMKLDGQWQLVAAGSVVDVADAGKFPAATQLRNETAGTLITGNHPTSIPGRIRTL